MSEIVDYHRLHSPECCRASLVLGVKRIPDGFVVVTRCACGPYSTEAGPYATEATAKRAIRALYLGEEPPRRRQPSPTVAPHIREKGRHWQVRINRNGTSIREAFPTFEEALAARDAYLLSVAA